MTPDHLLVCQHLQYQFPVASWCYPSSHFIMPLKGRKIGRPARSPSPSPSDSDEREVVGVGQPELPFTQPDPELFDSQPEMQSQSETQSQSQSKKKKVKPQIFTADQEDSVIEWLKVNECLFNKTLKAYKDTEMKN